jgi:hypothetical protein
MTTLALEAASRWTGLLAGTRADPPSRVALLKASDGMPAVTREHAVVLGSGFADQACAARSSNGTWPPLVSWCAT